jgi:hypothetical protein
MSSLRSITFFAPRPLEGVNATRCKELETLARKGVGLSPALRRWDTWSIRIQGVVLPASVFLPIYSVPLVRRDVAPEIVIGAMLALVSLEVVVFSLLQRRWLHRCMTELHAQLVCDCGYPLVGVPDLDSLEGQIRQCPECGLKHRLSDLRGAEQAAATTMTTVTEPHASTMDEK